MITKIWKIYLHFCFLYNFNCIVIVSALQSCLFNHCKVTVTQSFNELVFISYVFNVWNLPLKFFGRLDILFIWELYNRWISFYFRQDKLLRCWWLSIFNDLRVYGRRCCIFKLVFLLLSNWSFLKFWLSFYFFCLAFIWRAWI